MNKRKWDVIEAASLPWTKMFLTLWKYFFRSNFAYDRWLV